MIPRYTRKEMEEVWTDENKFKKYLELEIAVLEGWSKIGVIPYDIVEKVKEKAKINIERINEIEKITNHDVIAFIEQISETVGDEGKYIHLGLTSSDIIDTSFALILREAGNIILDDIKNLLEVLKKKAIQYKDILIIGRTHGIHAEPITLGFKIGTWYFEFLRNKERIERAINEISVGKISGAVGTFSNIEPEIEEYVCNKFNLKREKFSTQIISRDRYAYFITVLGIIACSCEKIALQFRLLQQTEISEVFEPFGKKQKGSSAMPHKRNPILCERICGLSRIIKKNVNVALENVALWHERDISHSSAERLILPESTILLDYILNLLTKIIDGMEINIENIEKNMKILNNVYFSQKLLNFLVLKGWSRKDAYEKIQKISFEAMKKKVDFCELIKKDDSIKKYIKEDELNKIFDIHQFLKNIEKIFKYIE
ncbi:MAG: adenylosuccinate lyase [Candidatus Omnitrophica bacterium]|nr:adenylosuccinate lyase [Candidatus Omnitrophota bacterium]MCM8801861.1 adenylosuccinate lyase [Candidatus Omnitrophota bacterium]